MAQRRNKPRHALYGFAAGAHAFGTSVASGLEGLAMKPIEGAEQGGAGGFFKGVGKGLVGIVTKPVVGVFDFASTATQGIRNTTTVFDGGELERSRLTRYIAPDGILRVRKKNGDCGGVDARSRADLVFLSHQPFSSREALGQSWLKDLENGKYFSETYVAHLGWSTLAVPQSYSLVSYSHPLPPSLPSDFPNDDSVCMITNERILLLRSIKLKQVWDVPYYELQSISLEPSGISLVLKGGVAGPFLPLGEQGSKVWLYKRIEGVVISYNKQRAAAEL